MPLRLSFKVILLIVVTLFAFAGNSILSRLALADQAMDASSFTIIRLASGALVLMLLVLANAGRQAPSDKVRKEHKAKKGSWQASIALFLYAICFSYAYVSLDTGTGALILFACVQATMILIPCIQGSRLGAIELTGIATAFGGLVYLTWPDLGTPSASGFLLMSMAGISWGAYSLYGRGSRTPLRDTAYNFMRTLPFVFALLLWNLHSLFITLPGLVWAVASGALCSGLGYSLWYRVLRHLKDSQAAVLQLLVPPIAALGGALFLGELISPRLAFSSLLILGGILLVILGRQNETL